MKRRALSFIFLCFLPAVIVLFLGLFYVPVLLARLGIVYVDGLMVMLLPALSMSLVFVVLWHHFGMKLSFPSFSEVFLHPSVMKERFGKIMIVLAAFIALNSLLGYSNTPIASLVSIIIIFSSLYVLVIELEITRHFSEYTKLMNPLKRKDEL
jgi:hypothetical protein